MVDDHFERIKIGGYGEPRARRYRVQFENVLNPIEIVMSDTELSSKIGKASFQTERDRSRLMHHKPSREQIGILHSRFFSRKNFFTSRK